MQPATLDFTGGRKINIGADWDWTLTFVIPGTTTPIPFNETDKFTFQIRPDRNSKDVIYEMSTTNGLLSIVDAAAGQLKCRLPRVKTYGIEPGKYVYAMIRQTDIGDFLPILTGQIEAEFFI